MKMFTVKCKPCGHVLTTTPRVTERVLTALRTHITHECAVRGAYSVGNGEAGDVLRGVNVEEG